MLELAKVISESVVSVVNPVKVLDAYAASPTIRAHKTSSTAWCLLATVSTAPGPVPADLNGRTYVEKDHSAGAKESLKYALPRLETPVELSISARVTSVELEPCEKLNPSNTGISQIAEPISTKSLVSLLKYKISAIVISYVS